MSFWYHMFGDNIGTMDVNVNGHNEFTVTGQQQTANCQPWLQGIVDVSQYAGTTIEVQICMSEGNGSISTFESDISVDHIQVFACQPVGLPAPWTGSDIGNNPAGNDFDYDRDTEIFTVVNGGSNGYSNTQDNMAFASQAICGNGFHYCQSRRCIW